LRLFAQWPGVLVEEVDVDVVKVVVVEVDVDKVDVDVDVLVEVDVLVVVVSHPVHVLSHCFRIESDEQSPTASSRSHRSRGNTFLLLTHR
jgi:hypothetical protein